MGLLDKRPAWSMSGGELLSTLDALEAEIAGLESYRLKVIAAIESTGYAAELGARDTAELLRFRYRLDAPLARRTLRLAQALPKYPAVAAALDQHITTPTPGEADAGWLLRPAQADAIVSALERVPSHVPIEDRDAAEAQLVDLAGHLSPSELRQAGNRMRDILDTDGPEPEEHKGYDRESLTLTSADRGVTFRGYLANENAELLRALIHAGARPHKTVDGEHDPRSREKRQADALTTALSVAATTIDTTSPASPDLTPAGTTAPGAGSGDVVPGFGAKAQVTVTIDFQDLKAATANADGRLVYGDGLSAATVRRLACDARIIPLVLGTNSEPLDVGRGERLVTRAMRRALNARDRGCVICGAPPIMCDAHHLQSWIDGGETKVSNLVLLCRRHHVDLHRGQWTVTIVDGTVHVARPTWAEPPPSHRHRRPDQTPTPPTTTVRPPMTAPPPVTTPPTPSTAPPTTGRPPSPWYDATATADAMRGATPSDAPPASPPSATPAAGDPVVPITRHSRWKADESTLREAANSH